MQQLQMNPPWECGLISLINSYLTFSFFHFSTTTLLKLGVCVNIFIMNQYISKSYTRSKNTIYRAAAAVVSTITSLR